MTRLKLLSLLSLQLLGPALRIQVAAFDVLMVIGKLSAVKGSTLLSLNTESHVIYALSLTIWIWKHFLCAYNINHQHFINV